jgi:transposase
MGVWVGIDVAKEVHWACVVDDTGQVVWDQRVDNDPAAIGALIEELGVLGQGLVVGMDVVGGIANLVQAMLAAAGFRLVYVSGLAVNRARQGTRGGESKSDPRDARVIADQVRTRRDLRSIRPSVELDLEIRLLAGRRRDLTDEQTRRLSRLHDLLASVHPGLERACDLTTKGGLWLVSRYVTPAEIRAAGHDGLVEHLQAAGGLPSRQIQALADRTLAAATAQQQAVPAERLTADLARELATEALTCRARLAQLDRDLDQLLARHPDAALIRSLPGMGAVLVAEFIAQAGDLGRFTSADQLCAQARNRSRSSSGRPPSAQQARTSSATWAGRPSKCSRSSGPMRPSSLLPKLSVALVAYLAM